jgi:hypothetical protein
MNIVNFIESVHDRSYVKNNVSIGFFGAEEYPLLFFSQLLESIKQAHVPADQMVDLRTIDWLNQSDADIISSLKTLFLGMRMIYWLGNLEDLETARKKKWISFLKEYQGPHLILFYTKELLEDLQKDKTTVAGAKVTVEIPNKFDKKLFLQLLNSYYPDMTVRNQTFVTAVYTRTDALSCDQVYILKQYLCLVGKNQTDFINQWLNVLVEPEKSLFALSQHFFAQEPHKFFSLWKTISADYPAPFWVVYWSEQLFRASNYVHLMHQRKGADAKRIAFRLPFSFIQRDWRLYTVQKLRDAHTAIYMIDFNIKNGGSENELDLFYSRFFEK